MPTPLRDARDTFLHFMSDNLSMPVHAMRCDPNDPSADLLMPNAVNIEFLNVNFDTISVLQVVIDVLNDDENTAADWMESVWQLLRSAFYTTVFNYTVPATPVSQHTNIMWDRGAVKFRRVSNNNYTHYSCILPVKFSAII